MLDQLRSAYRNGQLVLFVGAGVSMGLGLPSWRELIGQMAEELGFDADIYQTYGDQYSLAEYYRIQKKTIGPLRSYMDVAWHSTAVDIGSSDVHRLIATGHFPLIYTTNYDRWLEKAFDHYGRPYQKIVGVGDMARSDRAAATQIVKFHGDFDEDSSIVLDESSYFSRLSFEGPLDIKLRADVLGRSVLFIGYGFGDMNIRLLFFKLANLWQQAGVGDPPPSYLYVPVPNPVQEAVLKERNIFTLTSESDDPGEGLVDLLETITQT